jgi:AcrR family transcriptional regulator
MKAPPDDLARRLMDASDEILRLDGEVKLEEVARAVGVARATLYYYFSGREDLVAFVLARHLDGGSAVFAAAAAGDGSVEGRLRAVLEALVGFLAEHPGVCAGLLSVMGAGGRIDEVIRANDRAVTGPLRDLLIEGRALGVLAVDDPTDAANALVGGMLIPVLARAVQGRLTGDNRFKRGIADQLVRSVAAQPLPVGVSGDAAVDDQVDPGDP